MVPLKIALWVAGSVSVGAAAATATGIIDVGALRNALFGPPSVTAEAPAPQPLSSPSEPLGAPATDQGASEAAALADPAEPPTLTDPVPETATPAAHADDLPVPHFDILRVEPDGSVLIAGSGPAGASIEVIVGSRILTETVAGPNGDFVAVLDDALEPDDYQLVLRATAPDGRAVTSVETAIVSIPDSDRDEVLALVEAPGDPSRLISTPHGGASALVPIEQTSESAPEPASEPAIVPQVLPVLPPVTAVAPDADPSDPVQTAALEDQTDVLTDATPDTASDLDIRIEAVEIDGATVFVAGAATPGSRVRVYANDMLLGDTLASEQGRFLIEVRRDLPVGDYIIRADVIDSANARVLMRAAVPFARAQGERLAAVAAAPSAVLPAGPPPIPFDQLMPDAAVDTAGDGSQVEAPQQALSDAPQIDAPAETVVVAPQALGVLQGPPPVPGAQPANDTATLVPVDRSVIIRRGDTLWQISRRVYGEGVKYTTIYLANQDQIINPDRIWPGQVFGVPDQAAENAEDVHRQLRRQN